MKSTTALFVALNLFIESTTASCGHGTSFARRHIHQKRNETTGEETKTVAVGQFGYLGTQGPTNWQSLAVENAACSTSDRQSPIDINPQSTTLIAPGDLTINFPAIESAEFENIGTTIEVVMEGKNASTTVGGKTFALKQFHFHTPGEHTIDGQYFPLEVHMVHEAEDLSIAVIAVPFQLSEDGSTTGLIPSILASIDPIRAPGTVTATGPLDFTELVNNLSAQVLRTYKGSLTTPPCAEGLTFFVASEPLPLDVKSYNTIKGVVGFNARFIQNPIGTPNLLSVSPVGK